MKRQLTFVAIAIALGTLGWRGAPTAQADEPTAESKAVAFDQTGPVVDAASGDDQSSDETAAPEIGPTPAVADDDTPAADQRSDEAPTPAASDPTVRIGEDGVEIEVIHERFPNGTTNIEREVTQDAEGNYVNHGVWRMWDATGTLTAEGKYHYGQRTGVWNRWYRTGEVELLKTVPFSTFHGPYVSQATFEQGRLNGKWTVYDRQQHKISEWEFVQGARHGTFSWWYPGGQKMRECHYDSDEMNGEFVEWSSAAKVTAQATYQHGRRLGSRTDKNKSGVKVSEGGYLFAREVLKTPDDWWNATPAAYTKQGNDERHGHWISWFPNGQKHYEGEYNHDVQVGQFTWWYANGQKAIHGEFADGEQQGKWVWWHQNGQKSIQGDYENGHPLGQWTWWNQDGKVAKSSELERGAGEIVQAPATLPTPAQAGPVAPAVPRTANRNQTPAKAKPATVR